MRNSRRYLSILATSCLLSEAANTTLCNGYTSLCAKPYSNVTFLGAHNSYAVGSSISDNQNYDVTTQLNDGIRLLQGQGHNGTNKMGSMVELCHTSCALQDGGTLESYLNKVKSWVQNNPQDVVTILWVNSDNMPASNWAAAYESSGLKTYSYAPSSGTVASWPTLQALIDAGTPVVNFLTSQTSHAAYPYLLGEWDNIWETPYENTNNAFNCDFDRGTRPNQLYLANHFAYKTSTILGNTIDSPDTSAIDTTNSVSNMAAHANLCASQNSRYPNFFLVDFYEKASGGALQAVANLNDVVYTQKQLGSGAKAASSAIKAFFGGQNEIRNIAIVAAAGLVALILFWVGCCCLCRRRRRRCNSTGSVEAHKPMMSAAAPFAASSAGSSVLTTARSSYQEPKYSTIAASPGFLSEKRMSNSELAYQEVQGHARPLPRPPSYPTYATYRNQSPTRYGYEARNAYQGDRGMYY